MRISVALIEHILSDKVIGKRRDGCTVMRTSNREVVDSGFVKETVK